MSDEPPSIEQLRSTVDRMEQQLGSCNSNNSTELMGHYWALVARFEIDLSDERDRLLNRSGALMLIQAADPGEDDPDE
ncbi:MAG TPA: hypothetical protein VGV37_24210 [Aliidongia sp.]|uniref:hypothetical protein n=1 Tax=Aliidongia sp. TaxID=1914230 RepID=UPI002DDCB351|nr:hypothetical protein [Aliidongia sp.]HEV2677657.1 hypothetical protein [Aliidongia sp.]